jgi:acetyl esterase/lipase
MASESGLWLMLLLSALRPLGSSQAQDDKILLRKDVPFVAGGGSDQQLDLYLPGQAGFPTILYLHEGSLTSGDRKDKPYEAIGYNFAHAGIGFAISNYRLGPEHEWPAMAEDAAAAFAWVKVNIRKFHGNPQKVFVVGHSSGALIAALISTDEKYLKNVGCSLSDAPGCVVMGSMLNPSYDTDSIPHHVLDSLWKRLKQRGGYESLFETPDAYRDADPYRHVNSHAPPFLVLIAETEQFQPPILEQANRFCRAMGELGVPVTIDILKNRNHYTAMKRMAEANDSTFLRIVEFVKSH